MTHYKLELEKAGFYKKGDDGVYDGMIGKAIEELMEVFEKQGHSGMSAGIVANLFKKLVNYEVLTPLTGEEDEWGEWHEGYKNGKKHRQNMRYSTVFQDEDGKSYQIDRYIFDGWICSHSRKDIDKFPYMPITEYIDTKDYKPEHEELVKKYLSECEEE
jgi:hypothetical protein